MEVQKTICATNAQSGNPEYRMASPINLEILAGEQIAIIGDNASGKTRLVETLSGNIPVQGMAISYDFSPSPIKFASGNIRNIAFRDTYGDADSGYYFQKRWNLQDIDDDTPTAGLLLDRAFNAAQEASARFLDDEAGEALRLRREELRERLYGLFHMKPLLDKFIISLSSGELRKFQLTKALLYLPRVLVLDNPFIGLDAPSRDTLASLLEELTQNYGLNIIAVLPRHDFIPGFITHVIPVEDLGVKGKIPVREFLASHHTEHPSCHTSLPSSHSERNEESPAPEIIRCNNVTIRYGTRTILKDFNWVVREGERWALTGNNGSGKSTLLSLVCADNPQSYACDIELFGRKRGTGESIWDIKRHIGYVSPEMHRAYLKNIPALDIVASGLFDTLGMFKHASPGQLQTCLEWMDAFGIRDLADRSYLKLSSGEQRLCLLARAFVKDPDLLILDEPMHGLDERNCSLTGQIIDTFSLRPHKTLVMVTHYESELPSCIDHRLCLSPAGQAPDQRAS